MADILLTEDDAHAYDLLKLYLEDDHHVVQVATNGEQTTSYLKERDFDLIILDWMLPDTSGPKLCQQYRAGGGQAPVLMLTARSTAQDKADGLDSGADDYMVKPVNRTEFSSRIRALLRRPKSITGTVLRICDLELDTRLCQVKKSGVPIELTQKEFALLELLMRYPNQTFSVESIIARVWKPTEQTSELSVRTHMKTLRHKLGDNREHGLIKTRVGAGYRISAD